MTTFVHSVRIGQDMTPTLPSQIQRVSVDPDDSCATFATILDTLVRDRGLSNLKLGLRAHLDHSFISRLRTGDRLPSRSAVLAIAEAMWLDGCDRDRLLISAGYFPWTMPDEATLWMLRQILEVSE